MTQGLVAFSKGRCDHGATNFGTAGGMGRCDAAEIMIHERLGATRRTGRYLDQGCRSSWRSWCETARNIVTMDARNGTGVKPLATPLVGNRVGCPCWRLANPTPTFRGHLE